MGLVAPRLLSSLCFPLAGFWMRGLAPLACAHSLAGANWAPLVCERADLSSANETSGRRRGRQARSAPPPASMRAARSRVSAGSAGLRPPRGRRRRRRRQDVRTSKVLRRAEDARPLIDWLAGRPVSPLAGQQLTDRSRRVSGSAKPASQAPAPTSSARELDRFAPECASRWPAAKATNWNPLAALARQLGGPSARITTQTSGALICIILALVPPTGAPFISTTLVPPLPTRCLPA